MKYKPGDIVVVTNHKGVHPYWFKLTPIGLVTCVGVSTFSKKAGKLSMKLLDKNYVRSSESTLRLATQREQFLYHILGPFVLGENIK